MSVSGPHSSNVNGLDCGNWPSACVLQPPQDDQAKLGKEKRSLITSARRGTPNPQHQHQTHHQSTHPYPYLENGPTHPLTHPPTHPTQPPINPPHSPTHQPTTLTNADGEGA